jgi:hypothetical protein
MGSLGGRRLPHGQIGAERFRAGGLYPVSFARWAALALRDEADSSPSSPVGALILPSGSAITPYCLLTTFETVAAETPARAATSLIETRERGSTSARIAV